MKKRGFTLIELLAVIVILAIIALIATPIVMNVIENARKGAAERSASNYVDAVEVALAAAKLDAPVADGTYEIKSNGNILISKNDTCNKYGCGEKYLKIDMNGTKPTGGSITIENGQVKDSTTYLKFNKRTVNLIEGATISGNFDVYMTLEEIKGQTTAIQYDPVKNIKCTSGDTCYNWYVLEDKGSDYAYVTLIMDQKLGDQQVAWCGDETLCKTNGNWVNTKGPITAMNYLKSQTSNWTVDVDLPTIGQIENVKFDWLDGSYWTKTRVPISESNTMANYVSLGSTLFTHITSKQYIRPIIIIPKTKLTN